MNASANAQILLDAIPAFAGRRVLVVGDLMLDHYLFGDVSRISPEGPVPVVKVLSERHLLGGAGNVARNIAALGGRPFLLSVCGDDEPGAVLTRLLDREKIDSLVVRDPTRPTTVKTRIIAQNQQVARVDRETDEPVGGEVLAALLDALDGVLPEFSHVIVSDYAKGVIVAKLMDALRTGGASGRRPMILVDPKTVHPRLYEGVDLLTPNAKEAGELTGLAVKGKNDVIRAGLAIFRTLRCAKLCVTLGAQGVALFESPDTVRHIPTVARRVFDVTGAGDSVIAALGLGLASGLDLLRAAILANHCAGVVVGQVGAAAVGPEELAAAIRETGDLAVSSWLHGDTPPRP